MLVLPAVTAVICLLLSADFVRCQRYIVPEAKLELLSPRGLKISIPDIDDEVKLVAFHININEEFYSLEHGLFAQDIIKKRDGRWMYYIPEFKVKQGDTIYYWIYVIVDKLGYHGLDREYKVTQADPHGPSSSTPPRAPAAPTPSLTPTLPPPPPSKKPPSTVIDRDTTSTCHVSLTSRNGGLSACRGQVIFQKRFNDQSGWTHEVYLGGDEADDEFTVFTKDSATSKVENGNLVIKPILLEEKYDENFVQSGTLDLEGMCTSSNVRQCSKTAQFYLILPPVMSSRLTTKSSFSFRYGIVEIRAKLPQGDWIVPELWLLPKAPSYGDRSGQIVMGLSRGNVDFASADGNWLLEAGVIVNNSRQLVRKTGDTKWSQDFHNFKLVWSQDEMVFYVDSEEVARLPSGAAIDPSLNSGKLAPFDKEFYLSLGVHVGGCRDFPDSIQNKPWKNTNVKRLVQFWGAKGSWHPTWNTDSVLRVESVKVTAI